MLKDSLTSKWPAALGMLVAVLICFAPCRAKAEQTEQSWLDLAEDSTPTLAETGTDVAPVLVETGWKKPIPFTFGIDYTLVSDYVWRGINLSEYPGEGREKLNHQMGLYFELGTEDLVGVDLGTFGGTIWFEYYTNQESLTGGDDDHLQEVDFVVYWYYEIAPIFTTVEFGYINYHFPQLTGDLDTTQEIYVKISFDDSVLFGTEGSVLNPYFYYGLDIDIGEYGSWMEWGVSHDFAFAEMGMAATPILKDMTLSPSLVLGFDHRYMHLFSVDRTNNGRPTTKLANLNYGLTLSFDLSGALGLPEQFGSLTLAGFLNFSQALNNQRFNDEFYGGMTVGYEW